MIKLTFVGLAAVALLSAVSMAQAKSIKAEMSSSQIAAYCTTAGVNTTSDTTIDIGGKSVTGSVKCTPNDMKTASASADGSESEAGTSETAENGQED